MYTTKAVLPAHGRLTLRARFYIKGGVVNGMVVRSGVFEEVGFSQSQNVKFELKILINDALFNAFYRLLYKLGIPTYEKTGEDLIGKLCSKVTIKHYIFDYYEDRIYSYKRTRRVTETKKGKPKGRYVVEVRRRGRFHKDVEIQRISKKDIQEHQGRFY